MCGNTTRSAIPGVSQYCEAPGVALLVVLHTDNWTCKQVSRPADHAEMLPSVAVSHPSRPVSVYHVATFLPGTFPSHTPRVSARMRVWHAHFHVVLLSLAHRNTYVSLAGRTSVVHDLYQGHA
jgi:hypothetical protein